MSRPRECEAPPGRRQRRRIDLLQEESQALAKALQAIEDTKIAEALQAAEDSQAFAEALQAAEDSQAFAEALQVAEDSQAFAEAEQAAEALQAAEDSQEKLQCNICYDDIENDGKGCPSQNCFAVFHERCIVRWTTEGKDTCAMCQV